MWLSPWNNVIHGGDQLADSLWAFATGGLAGMGIGLGDPQLVPAAHTDLILSALGEEWGFLGVAAVFALYAFIVWRALRIALRARRDYEFFLAAGLAAATALQILLIAGGALGVLPLSGVVTPFLSYGRTAMLANFAVIADSALHLPRPAEAEPAPSGSVAHALPRARRRRGHPLRRLRRRRAGQGRLRASGSQRRGDGGRHAGGRGRWRPPLPIQSRAFRTSCARSPRAPSTTATACRSPPATGSELEKHRAEYPALGIDIDRSCSRTDNRHYPFGGLMFDLLGDLRTRTRWAAGNTSFVERDSARRLRGYDDRPTLVEVKNPKTGALERVIRYDYRELVPLVRHRYDPPESRRAPRARPSARRPHVDRCAPHVRVADILRSAGAGRPRERRGRGARSTTGDLLAAVSLPLPPDNRLRPQRASPGRCRPIRFLSRPRALRPLPAWFHVQSGHRHGRSAQRPAARRIRPTSASACPMAASATSSKARSAPSATTFRIRRRTEPSTWSAGSCVSCNAYFAQLGTYDVGAEPLLETANLLGISVAAPPTAAQLRKSLPQSSYGQGQVVASPFQMARVAATVATGGAMPQGRWIADETNPRTAPPQPVLTADAAATLGKFMREVVTSGTGRRAEASVPIAGKTGTAELASAPSHAWFIGFAPYGAGRAQNRLLHPGGKWSVRRYRRSARCRRGSPKRRSNWV